MLKFALPATALALLAGCGDVEQQPDTTYEQTLNSPVPQGEASGAPAPDNETMAGGPDEQVDASAPGAGGAADDTAVTDAP